LNSQKISESSRSPKQDSCCGFYNNATLLIVTLLVVYCVGEGGFALGLPQPQVSLAHDIFLS
jgi:hypothetical protein